MTMSAGCRSGKAGKRGLLLRRVLCPFLAANLLLAPGGCTRRFFRQRADREVAEILTEKDKNPAWKIEQYHPYPDPRARFFDPSNPDRPPMPPDDPAAHDLSPNPQKPGKAGVGLTGGKGYLELLAQWDAENRARDAAEAEAKKGQADGQQPSAPPQNVQPVAYDRVGPGRSYLVNIDQAAELGIINSREFQDRREDLYMTALPVTLERFAFAAQFFAAGQAIREWSGRESPEGPHNRWEFNGLVGFSKLFSTGALLLAQIANQTVVELNGGRTTSLSTATLDLIQPLLRGGGRAVTLEPLTQAERNLLYQIRAYARFRKEFYVAIAGGGGGSISGGVFVPTGVIAPTFFSTTATLGGSGLTPGSIPSVPVTSGGPEVTPGTAGRLPLSAAIPASVSGYLGTLLQFAQINIDRDNIVNLEHFLKLFEAYKEGGDLSQLQVDTVEQQLLTGRSTLLLDEQQYQDFLDRFKLQLGLPTDFPLELEDTPLRGQIRQFARYLEIFQQYTAATDEAAQFGAEEMAPRLRAELHRLFTSSAIVRGTRFRTRIEGRWAAWEKLTADELKKRLSDYAAERQKILDLKTDLEVKGQTLSAADQARLTDVENEIDLGSFEQTLRDYEAQPWKQETDPQRRRTRQGNLFRFVLNAFALVLGEARNDRLEALRGTWPELPRLCLEGTDLLQVDLEEAEALAGRTALANRLDLMNVRGQLVDAWRQIAVFANALMGTFNVEYRLDSFTPLGTAKPLDFGGSRYRHQLFLNGQLPLVRVAERNNYRASLINYQRERRTLMEAEDLSVQVVRGEIRQLRVLAEQYKIQQRQVELAYRTVESSLDTFQAPPAAGGPQAATNTAVSGAALTNQLLMAQRQLPLAQNSLLSVWVNYLNTRLQLYRDLELMPLDNRGVWIDEFTSGDCGSDNSGRSSDPACQPPGVRLGLPLGPVDELPEPIGPPLPVPPAAGPALENQH